MINIYPTPKLAESVLAFFAGPGLEDEMLGDLQERYGDQNRPYLWYWTQVLRSIPALLQMNLRNMSNESWIAKSIFMLFGLTLIWFWEVNVAQKLSWPTAKAILAYSPLTATQTCKAIYIIFYSLALAVCLLGLSGWQMARRKNRHFRYVHILLLTLTASVPIVYYCINPGPYDGTLNFRVFQITLVWSLMVCAFILPNLLSRVRANGSGLF